MDLDALPLSGTSRVSAQLKKAVTRAPMFPRGPQAGRLGRLHL